MKKIFIVEDDKSICMELVEILENEGYAASYLTDFEHSKEEILAAGADLILMDINIPGINGRNLLKEIRKESDIPVIMVTSRTSEMDEVLSMSYGADDYITKPYNPTILLTKNEMIIFQLLLSSKDKIVSRDEIMTDLWDNEEYVNDNALTVNISRLRTKLAELGLPDAIETRKKQGYRLI